MRIRIKPVDTLFFRDSRPFMMGDETWADTVFPPFPSVFYGALRTVYYSNNIHQFHLYNDTGKDVTVNLIINGIYIADGNYIYLPAPLDCGVLKEKNKKFNALLLKIERNENIISSSPFNSFLIPPEKEILKSAQGYFIDIVELKEYLNNDKKTFKFRQNQKFFVSEPKIGIKRKPETHSSESEKLYRTQMIRLKDTVGFIIDFENLNIPLKGFIKIGGESKASVYIQEEKENLSLTPNFNGNEKRFKLYLMTPAIFNNGWLPAWIDEKTLEGKKGNLKLKLITCAIGKHGSAGGFDMKEKIPKTMYRTVPAGSVYYFEISNGNITDAVRIFNMKSISDIKPDEGFGLCLIGKF